MSSDASADLRRLSADLVAAGEKIYPAATGLVHGEANRIETEIRSIDGNPTSVVLTYPAAQSARIVGTERYGVAQQDSSVDQLEGVDLGDMAGSLASGLADAGVNLIVRGSA